MAEKEKRQALGQHNGPVLSFAGLTVGELILRYAALQPPRRCGYGEAEHVQSFCRASEASKRSRRTSSR
jgi:hypothetical protein